MEKNSVGGINMNSKIELSEYNSSNSKVYLNGDGTISVEIYDQNINDGGIMTLSDEPTIGDTSQYNPDNTMISQGNNAPFNIVDTYISSSRTTTGEEDKIKIGVEKINGNNVIHRALLKFDLPKIPSSYTLVNATLNMIGYYDENYSEQNSNTMIAIHQITSDWLTTSPTWANMANGYKESIENYFHATRSSGTISGNTLTVEPKLSQIDVTDLVQRWYNNEPNYGLMLKAVDETYNENIKLGEYYTVDAANESAKPQARLVINYKNLNGLEGYLTYTSQSHELGSTHINNYNGNVTSLFSVANTVGGPLPASIDLVYNTSDVVNNNDYGYGLGVKPNLIQTIKEVTIDTLNVLQYLDEDGTIHYFYKNSDDNIYYDEDGLSLKVEPVASNYIMTDKNKNTNKFVNHNGTYYLEQITDTTNKSINIVYDTNNRITKVIDASNKEITITYEDNKITFVSPYKTTIVNLTNNQIISIEDLGDTTTISYNDNKLIEKIINSNGLYTKYEYINDLTYKVSKVTEYGRNDSEGNYLEFTYNLKSTSIKDRKGHVNTYVFNNNANTEVITSLDENQNLSNAYGKSTTYGELGTSSVNKITLDGSLVRHINNLIEDSSFESGNSLFTTSNESITTEVIDNAHYGIKALKVTNTALDNYVYLEKAVEKGKDYTFSAYTKNEVPFELSLSYDDVIKTVTIDDISSEYSRCDITINYPEEATSNLNITIKPLALGVIYIDGLQLEEGEVANYYNMISNSNFANSLNGYEITTSKRVGIESHYDTPPLDIPSVEVVQVDGSTKALRLINSPLLQTTLAKSFYMSGHAGDVFELSFWYKNEGPRMIPSETNPVEPATIYANLHFGYTEGENDEPTIDQYLTPYNKDWHYFSKKFVAKYDYNEVSLNIINEFSCRDCYITNISLFKDLESYSYTYDDEGNLVSSTDLSRETSTFNYNGNNQLIEATSPLGNKFKYEYDENVTDRLIRAISPSGITNSIDYDENNNPIKTVINNTQAFDEIIDTTYYIIAKGTDRYLYIKPDKNLMVRQCECSHDKFNVIKQTDNKIKLQYTILNNYYLKDNGGVLKVEYGDTGNNIFELIEHSNKTYSIKSVSSNLAVTVNEDNTLSLTTYNEDSNEQQFLFERMESKLFIESSSTYTEDGRFIRSVKDSLGNIVTYDIDNTTGLTNAVIDPNGSVSNYVYDDKHRVTSITKGEHEVSYEYDTNDNLSKITHGTKNYCFEYDEYNNNKKVTINNTNLIEKIYENNNGNLTKVKYGNNDEINYTYDEYGRVKTVVKEDNTYKNYYDNLGRITRVNSNNEVYNYEYDFAKRLSKFKINDYETLLNYDKDNNITTKIEKIGEDSYTYNYAYNNESALTNLNVLDT
ncbi:MAG: RHS repeat protein, partial [Firmicutes bacterium]|nr:RHS repeat protein [Bacillota bacterium]